MKRIGILTFHTSINNGAVMQCYSLSKKLQQMFPTAEIEVIDYRMPKIEKFYDTSLKQYFSGGQLKSKLSRLKRLVCNPRNLVWQQKRKTVFENCLCQLPLSERTIIDDETSSLFQYMNDRYDIVIAGSDAIWNYVVRGYPNPYFLDTSVRSKKLAYAASCYGMSYENIESDRKLAIAKILESYHFLGARDSESEKFVREMGCTKSPVHTCDPTVFLDVDDLPVDVKALEKKLSERGFDFSKPTIGIMGTELMCSMVRKMYGKTYQIAALYNYCKGADVNLYDLTPYEWAYVFRYFKLTFTTFFHGTLLSLRNGTPVVCIALKTEYAKNHITKVEDMLVRIGMQDCYFSTDYKNVNFAEIKAKADELLHKDCKKDICARMDQEATTSQPFMEALEALLKED